MVQGVPARNHLPRLGVFPIIRIPRTNRVEPAVHDGAAWRKFHCRFRVNSPAGLIVTSAESQMLSVCSSEKSSLNPGVLTFTAALALTGAEGAFEAGVRVNPFAAKRMRLRSAKCASRSTFFMRDIDAPVVLLLA